MNLPASVGVAMVALVLGGNGLALAAHFFWRRHRSIFWVVSTLIVVGVGYLVATGAAEDVARSLWPIPFDPIRTRDFEARFARDHEKWLGAMLIILPFWVALAWVSWQRRSVPLFPSILLVVFLIFLFTSPISARFARLVLPDHVLKAPAEQLKARQSKQQ